MRKILRKRFVIKILMGEAICSIWVYGWKLWTGNFLRKFFVGGIYNNTFVCDKEVPIAMRRGERLPLKSLCAENVC